MRSDEEIISFVRKIKNDLNKNICTDFLNGLYLYEIGLKYKIRPDKVGEIIRRELLPIAIDYDVKINRKK